MEIDGNINEKPDQEKARIESDTAHTGQDKNIISSQPNLIEDKQGNEQVGDQTELVAMLASYWRKIYTNYLIRKIIKRILQSALVVFLLGFIFFWFVFIVPGFQEIGRSKKPQSARSSELVNDQAYKKQIALLGKDAQRLSRKFAAYTSGQSYIVINTTDNRFFLYLNKKLVREGFCSTGSYTRLTNAEGSRHWIFKTPKGRFWIQQKITSPLWVRPDWSFVEEGVPIPPPNDESRFEYGVLGDYAMSLGDGYLIHGTIYKRFLGMPVTHGCVRLGDADLEAIYNTLNIGSKVYIF
jgi:lipoprotein-anchoring transpeptidase ErfK/SrfK